MLARVLGFLTVVALCGFVLIADADEGKKKKDKSGKVGAQDGTDDVRGAVWQVVAENEKAKKKEIFKFRVHEGVVFNMDGKKSGVVSSLGATKEGGVKSKLVWRESFPLTGDLVITQIKKGVWGGTLVTKNGDEWKCRFEVLDR